jgi:hypothetical protein
MRDDTSYIPVDGARATTLVEEIDLQCADEGANAKPFIAVIESSRFMQDCIRRSMQSAFSLPITTYSTVTELEGQLWKASPDLVILSHARQSSEDRHTQGLVGACSDSSRHRPCLCR